MKKVLSLIIACGMLFGAMLAGCNKQPAATKDPSESQSDIIGAETNPDGSPVETDPDGSPSEPESEYGPPPADGTLLYFEDFEGVGVGLDSSNTVAALGWTVLDSTNSVHNDPTASYTVKELNGSRALYIHNFDSNISGKASYVKILSTQQMGYFHTKNYTFQYDLTYSTALSAGEYINILSEHSGDFYNTFHLRNSGYAHNQCCIGGTFYRYAPYFTDENSVLTKLLGQKFVYNAQSLTNVTVSVRCVMDWENGNKVYVRTVDKNTASGGEWVLVSSFDTSEAGAKYFNSRTDGANMVLKVSGSQNGYIDNIVIWSGTGDEPADKTNAFINADTKCHSFVYTDRKELCVYCGKTIDDADFEWAFNDVPAYEGGKVSDAVYLSGKGIDDSQILVHEDKMLLVSETSAEEFEKYVQKLERRGFKKEYRRDADGNIFVSYVKDGIRAYAYYLNERKEVRVIRELTSVSSSIEDFGYSYEKKDGEQTVVYQYSMAMRDAAYPKDSGYPDNGMLYIIKLADNALILIDGGNAVQFPKTQRDNLMKMLRNITGTKDGEQIRIAAWYITHPHGDHYAGLKEFFSVYSKNFTLERVFFGLPSVQTGTFFASTSSAHKEIITTIKNYYGNDVDFLRIHTGQTFTLADVGIEVLFTHEDGVDAKTGESVLKEVNDSSSVIRITVDGKTIMFLGDMDNTAMKYFMKSWSNKTLQSDGIQLAHHVLNNVNSLYNMVQARMLLVPQSLFRINQNQTYVGYYNTAKRYAEAGMIFFQNEYTVGVAVVDGRWTKVYELPVVYDIQK